MNITIAGAGYVGMAYAAMLAEYNDVTIYDISCQKVAALNAGYSPIKGNDIEEQLKQCASHITATTDPVIAFTKVDYVIIATPTDYDEITNAFNTTSIENIIGLCLKFNKTTTIVIKSTVPIGYTNSLKKAYGNANIIFSPEFLREGNALYDVWHPSRIIIGEKSLRAEQIARIIVEGTKVSDVPVLFMSSSEAEAVKLFSNAYLAMRVVYFNEIDSFAESNNLNTSDIINGMCYDPRIGDFYNNPSFGYGGYCLPKDTKQLLASYTLTPQTLITAIVSGNQIRKEFIAERIIARSTGTIGVYRLVMKKESDNFRYSAIKDVILSLKDRVEEIIIYEPLWAKEIFLGCRVVNDIKILKERCDLIIVNRMDEELYDVKDKVYTRDIFNIN